MGMAEGTEGRRVGAGLGVVEPLSPARWAGGSEGGCTQMALGALGQWRRAQCAGRYFYLCEKGLTGKILEFNVQHTQSPSLFM